MTRQPGPIAPPKQRNDGNARKKAASAGQEPARLVVSIPKNATKVREY